MSVEMAYDLVNKCLVVVVRRVPLSSGVILRNSGGRVYSLHESDVVPLPQGDRTRTGRA